VHHHHHRNGQVTPSSRVWNNKKKLTEVHARPLNCGHSRSRADSRLIVSISRIRQPIARTQSRTVHIQQSFTTPHHHTPCTARLIQRERSLVWLHFCCMVLGLARDLPSVSPLPSPFGPSVRCGFSARCKPVSFLTSHLQSFILTTTTTRRQTPDVRRPEPLRRSPFTRSADTVLPRLDHAPNARPALNLIAWKWTIKARPRSS
jgi:hypothetical protein